MKRSAFIVNTKKFIYYRAPGEDDRPVHRSPVVGDKVDFLKGGSKAKLRDYKKGDSRKPVGYDEALLWEQSWLAEAIRRAEEGTSEHPKAPACAWMRPGSPGFAWERLGAHGSARERLGRSLAKSACL